jgi:hypothetical protein
VCLLTANGEFVPWGVRAGRDPHPAKARPAREARPAPAEARPRRRRQKATDSAELARLMGFVDELRRLSEVDERAGATVDPHRVAAPARPPEPARLDSGWPGRSGADAPPRPRPAPVPDLVVGGEREPSGAPSRTGGHGAREHSRAFGVQRDEEA